MLPWRPPLLPPSFLFGAQSLGASRLSARAFSSSAKDPPPADSRDDFLGVDLNRIGPDDDPANLSSEWKETASDDFYQSYFSSKIASLTGASSSGPEPSLSHLDSEGRARMVNVGDKQISRREATAEAAVQLPRSVVELLKTRASKKGDALTVAQIAGVLGAKRTPELIPLCHSLPLDDVQLRVRLEEEESRVLIRATVRCTGRTGCEMEALTGASVAALAIYDMCKSASKEMSIGPIRLLSKTGGKSDVQLPDRIVFGE